MEITIVLGLSFWLWTVWAVLTLAVFIALKTGLHFAGSVVALVLILALIAVLGLSVWLIIASIAAGLWWAAIIAALPLLFWIWPVLGMLGEVV